MADQNCPKAAMDSKLLLLQPSFLFHLFTVNLLGLLLPLSFLLLARLTSAQYLLALLPNPPSKPPPFFLSLILYINPALLYLLVFLVAISALFHSFTGKSALPNNLHSPISQPRLYTAWIFLCTLQLCVGVGIEGTLSVGLNDASSFGVDGGYLWSRLLFLLGLHQTFVHWSRVVVKPVVDDTIFGEATEERWFEKAATAVSFGGLWWWRLRDEVESLTVVAEAKKTMLVGLGMADFSGWCLYYMTVAIGIAKIFKSLAWVGGVLICKMECKVNSSATVDEVVDAKV